MDYQITLVQPAQYQHTAAFDDVVFTLQQALMALGHTARVHRNGISSSATNIIIGSHLLGAAGAAALPERSILYNLEQITGNSKMLSRPFFEMVNRFPVWDYSARNVETLAPFCKYAPTHVPIAYVPGLSRIAPGEEDIDVLFYGSMNPRRQAVISALQAAGLQVETAFGVYGAARDALIARAKVVLNVHFYDSKIFEVVRVSYLLANRKAVVTECGSRDEIEADLAEGVVAVPYEYLVQECLALVGDADRRRALGAAGLAAMQARDARAIVARAIETPTVCAADRVATIPPRLNIGSGKDWRFDALNIDINEDWDPDLVVDLNQPFPPQTAVATRRFGERQIERGYFAEIIANDVLEHIQELPTAMKSCLDLLQTGGRFHIQVPYDLSYGAWQDPTHVRAFNEMSWSYYTDWFWYFGWTDARFEVERIDFVPSAVGLQLRHEGVSDEEMRRRPRAIDAMQVVLRKRELTPQDLSVAARYNPRYRKAAAG